MAERSYLNPKQFRSVGPTVCEINGGTTNSAARPGIVLIGKNFGAKVSAEFEAIEYSVASQGVFPALGNRIEFKPALSTLARIASL